MSRVAARIEQVLGVVALAVFGPLALRHVGESYFLADQVDQLQNFESLLRLRPEGLWGPVMSGTVAHALGPVGAVVFGVPVALGLGVNAVHAITSTLLVITAGVAFVQLWRTDRVLAWTWALVFTAMRIVWWNAGLLWVNTLLLPCGLLMLALSVSCLRRPTITTLSLIVLTIAFALQVHLVALVALPWAAVMTAATWRRAAAARPTRTIAIVLAIAAALVVLPYVVAEAMTGLENTRAMLAHVGAAVESTTHAGRVAAVETLVTAADPADLLAPRTPSPIVIAAGVLIGVVALALWRRRDRVVAMLIVASLVAIAGQALFFLMMARPLNGLHYISMLAPSYALLPAALVSGFVPRDARAQTVAALVVAAAAVIILVVTGRQRADRWVERTDWSFRRIVRTLDALCSDLPVRTAEGAGLADDLNRSYDPVLRYLIKRGFTRCRYDPRSDVLIVGDQDGRFDVTRVDGADPFRRELVFAPGIARYRRVR